MYNSSEQREAFHLLFLERWLKTTDPRLYVVKGGVSLRFFFNSPRASEDMDIDVMGGAVATLKKNGYKILHDASFRRQLRTYGIDDLISNDPAKAKQTETTQRFRLHLVTTGGGRLPTKVEFSRRPHHPMAVELSLIHPELARKYQKLSFRCQHYSGDAMIQQKIRALAGRAEVQARDVFDIYILLAGGFSLPPEMRQNLPKDLLQRAHQNLEALSYADFQGHVLEFIEPTERFKYEGENTWQDIKDQVRPLLS